jgi:DNA repair protein RecO (recombination protein O)
MEETHNSQAIILNQIAYRENDSLITVYTKNFGKLFLIARGTKKLQSKLAGHLEPISLADILVIKGKGFDYIGSALTRDAFLSLKDDLNKLYYSGRAINYFSRLVKEGQADENLFFLLSNWLRIINDYSSTYFTKEMGELLLAWFIFKFMTELGYKPEMQHCLNCHQKIVPGKNYFNLNGGGLICGACFEKEQREKKIVTNSLFIISDNCIKLMRFIVSNNIEIAKRLKLDKRATKELSSLAINFLNFNH